MNEKWDVIICGGGPAGSVCGADLAKKGIKTLILEKEEFPRYKACGGGVTLKTLPYLDLDISGVVEREVNKVTLTYQMEGAVTRNSSVPLAWMVNRANLDEVLLENARRAGCKVEEGNGVTGYAEEDSFLRIATDRGSYETRILVGADGANSVIGHRMGHSQNIRYGTCIESEVNASASAFESWQDRVLLDLGSIPGGYAWIFPKKDHFSIGIGGACVDGTLLNESFEKFCLYARQEIAGFEMIRKVGHRLPTRCKDSQIANKNVLLVGDAAGLVEPLSGEGIYNAVRSGKIAAQAIAAHMRLPRKYPLTHYQKLIDKKIMPDIQQAKVFMKLFNRKPQYFYRKLCESTRLWQAACGLLSGEDSFISIREKLGNIPILLDALAW